MSFRELRNFCEVMRSLGYHRLISMENFRTPNFQLVAHCLDWLVHRYDPSVNIPDDIDTEDQRVEFIKRVVEVVAVKTRLRLNSKKLYSANVFAVRELLKLAMLLRDAQVASSKLPPDVDNDMDQSITSKLHDLPKTRALCSEIIESGAMLYDLLRKEPEMRSGRASALRFLDGMSRNLETNSEHEFIDQQVSSQLVRQDNQLNDLKRMCEELEREEKGTQVKIKKKAQDLERLNKQLSRLVTVRPQFMDEYEKLERELERLYDQYLERFRNLDYLEHELDLLNKAEQNKMEENERALKRMQKRLHEAEWRLLRGEQEGDGDELLENSKRTKNGQKRSQSRQKMHNEAKSNGAVMYGSMNAPDDSESGGDDTDLTDEIVSDSEPPISMGGSSDEDILEESSDESDEELAVGGGGAGGAAGRGKPTF
jgi:clusterin-associated protein 1